MINDNKIYFLDGAFGTELSKKGLLKTIIPESICIDNPNEIIKLHKEYINSGADIIYTATFGVNQNKLKDSKYTIETLVLAAVNCAKKAILESNMPCKIALDIGPFGNLLFDKDKTEFDKSYSQFQEIVTLGSQAGADLIVFETFSDLQELRCAILAAKENTSLPVFATMSFEKSGKTFLGVSVESAAITLTSLGVSAIGINCSLGPIEILPLIEKMSKYTNLPLIVKANAGMPNNDNEYDFSPNDFVFAAKKFLKFGVKFLGGCCGTSPEYIKALHDNFKDELYKSSENKISFVCSARKALSFEKIRIVGERINPTGKKEMHNSILKDDFDYLVDEAINQEYNGAEILDINVFISEKDENEIMLKTINSLNSACFLPLQFDSQNSNVLKNALRYYCGKAIINSVNATENSMNSLFPIAKKYGAMVVCLPIDENGIPKSINEYMTNFEKIIKKSKEFGITSENLIFDCLTLPCAVNSESTFLTLELLKLVKQNFKVLTTLGISNISYGLPLRTAINSTFLALALNYGLDLPIINPNSKETVATVKAFCALKGQDRDFEKFIKFSK